MKRILTIITALLITSSAAFTQNADMRVGDLINTGNWFELERLYPDVKDDVQTPMLKQMAEVMLASNFNRPDELREKLQKLIAEHQAELGFGNVCNMTVMGAMAEGYEGNYGVAADMVKAIADAVQTAAGSLEGTGIEGLLAYYESLRELPAPAVEKPSADVEIAFSEKSDQLLYIPVVVKGKTYDFIFDTGATLSMISQDVANEIGAKFIGDSVYVGGATGGGALQNAFIEKMDVGPITFRNALTFVSPNPADDDPLKVDAILGMDFIKRLGEIQIDMTGMTLRVPVQKTALPENGRNIILDQNIPIIEVTDSKGNKLAFTLDTGNSGADLTDLWFAKNAETAGALPIETQNTWGHGGTLKHEIVKVPECILTIGNASVTFNDIPASVPAGGTVTSPRDGNLGMGLLKKSGKITISFDEMFIKVE